MLYIYMHMFMCYSIYNIYSPHKHDMYIICIHIYIYMSTYRAGWRQEMTCSNRGLVRIPIHYSSHLVHSMASE